MKSLPFFYVLMCLVIFGASSFVNCKHALQMFQQNRYELYRYSKWLFDRKNYRFRNALIYSAIVLPVGIFLRGYAPILCLLITAAYAIFQLRKEQDRHYIKELALTARVKRQIAVLSVLLLLFFYACIRIFPTFITGILSLAMPYLMIYPMAVLTAPMEEAIKKRYENEARSILGQMDRLLKIGITGSYGKTSTKNIINDIISDDRYTLITPASYNTPMGITRTVREQLKPIHEVFVCEMGADKVSDITYLMDFVRPKYGVVTSIGPQHLATFGSLDKIIHEKMQEAELLPEDGVAFLNIDNEYIANYQLKNHCKVVTVGVHNENADYRAEDVEYSREGSSFTVKIDGRKHKFVCSLLGEHNVTNVLLGIAVAREMGMDVKQIVKKVKGIRQVEHRLEMKKINGFTFIDDAFNSNPVGSRMALDVLSMMPGKRVIVTPGMIDLGTKQEEINREFGAYMKDRADEVLLVGEKQTEPIRKGLEDSGFDPDRIIVFRDVREAFAYIYKNCSVKDTILLENDLPDAFNV